MKILAIELSSGRGSVAWLDATAAPCQQAFANDRKHSGLFFENLHGFLQRFGPPELIVVGLGPGSYTGTRIAIATATGLQAATGARLLGLASVRAFPTDAERYCVIGDARRNSFFFAAVARRECTEGPLLCTRDELLARLDNEIDQVFASEKMDVIPAVSVAYPSAGVLAAIAANTSEGASAAPLEPIYLRDPHITQPKRAAMLERRV
ncbi:MAG TPA: tRNA (adenosine(37)-N6)-threonylcarbamoyltransferase complex dimerization subunit type 1 TsaB [Chthoniobacterales bacterium]|nr:tRNA (adenosine(37)-N6)-threonylcarbamoyltransferase complex dimerization subunit type 1 TsaB [Chthoniobacterales bacterium]